MCDECDNHFGSLQALLHTGKVRVAIDPHIVRGLDYYTKTVFEIIMQTQRGELALCGGGRYDGLVKVIGGPELPGVGFGIGTERIILELQNQGIVLPATAVTDIFVASIGEEGRLPAFELCLVLRNAGLQADCDHMDRSLKAQFRYADKIGVRLLVIAGGEELGRGMIKVKKMSNGEEAEIALASPVENIKEMLSKIFKTGGG